MFLYWIIIENREIKLIIFVRCFKNPATWKLLTKNSIQAQFLLLFKVFSAFNAFLARTFELQNAELLGISPIKVNKILLKTHVRAKNIMCMFYNKNSYLFAVCLISLNNEYFMPFCQTILTTCSDAFSNLAMWQLETWRSRAWLMVIGFMKIATVLHIFYLD